MKKQKIQLLPGSYRVQKDGKRVENLDDPAMLIRADVQEENSEAAKPKIEKKEKQK